MICAELSNNKSIKNKYNRIIYVIVYTFQENRYTCKYWLISLTMSETKMITIIKIIAIWIEKYELKIRWIMEEYGSEYAFYYA